MAETPAMGEGGPIVNTTYPVDIPNVQLLFCSKAAFIILVFGMLFASYYLVEKYSPRNPRGAPQWLMFQIAALGMYVTWRELVFMCAEHMKELHLTFNQWFVYEQVYASGYMLTTKAPENYFWSSQIFAMVIVWTLFFCATTRHLPSSVVGALFLLAIFGAMSAAVPLHLSLIGGAFSPMKLSETFVGDPEARLIWVFSLIAIVAGLAMRYFTADPSRFGMALVAIHIGLLALPFVIRRVKVPVPRGIFALAGAMCVFVHIANFYEVYKEASASTDPNEQGALHRIRQGAFDSRPIAFMTMDLISCMLALLVAAMATPRSAKFPLYKCIAFSLSGFVSIGGAIALAVW